MPMTDKRYRLSELALDEISLVTAGDDPSAKVTLAKADRSGNPDHGGNVTTINTDGLPEEVVKHITETEQALADALELISADLSKDDDDDATDDSTGDDDTTSTDDTEDDTQEEDALSKADPIIKAEIAKLNERVEKAEAEARTERDLRLKKEAEDFVDGLAAPVGEKDELVKTLLGLEGDARTTVEKTLTAAAQQAKEGALFAEIGKGTGHTTTGARAESAAAEIRKANPTLTEEQALAQAYENDPSLYDEAISESKGA